MKHIFTLAFMAASMAMMAQVGLITWEVNMANETVSPEGVFLAGGDYFGLPGDNPLADDDGDGVWTITMAMPLDYTGAYTFTNGACLDYSCKENIVGQSCAFGTWSDRELPTVTGDATYSTCFSQCSTDGSCASVSSADVTFRVNMAEQIVTAGVFLHAGFDGWGSIPMTDEDGDNVFEHTASLESGSVYEYLFQNGPGGNEAFDSTYVECTLTSGAYTNRILNLETADAFVTDAFCFNSCGACQDTTGGDGPYNVTFNVNMANEEVDPTGVYLAGGADFGVPGDNMMTDEDGDGIYSITMSLASGYTGYYAFTNGACGDWSCKENLAGLPCGDPENYNDRTVGPINGATTISICFGQCSTDGSCEQVDIAAVTFRVDLSEAAVVNTVNIFGGSVNGWNNTATPMTDEDGDGIYEVTVELAAGGHEYKFIHNGSEEIFDPIVHGACTVTTADSIYTNRYVMVEGAEDLTTTAFCFNACIECETSNGVSELDAAAFELTPSMASESATLRFPVALATSRTLNIVGFSGALVEQFRIPAGTEVWTLNLTGYAPGIYFVNAQASGLNATRKLVVIQ